MKDEKGTGMPSLLRASAFFEFLYLFQPLTEILPKPTPINRYYPYGCAVPRPGKNCLLAPGLPELRRLPILSA